MTGRGATLKLLVAGDSAAAGVGASHQDEALIGQLVGHLARAYRVEWALEARTGATSASALARLETVTPRRFDVAVTSLGVNDVTRGVRRSQWRRRQRALRALLKTRFGVSRIVACGLPPVEEFPSLPQPLRWYLGYRARQLSRDLEADLETDPQCHYLDLGFARDAGAMASDGFHPGPAIYAMWGQRTAGLVLAVLGDRAASADPGA